MSKYRAVRVGKYASKREAARALELLLLERSGAITGLREQVTYVLAPSVIIQGRKRPALRYVCDFEYERDGVLITEDVKGVRTAVYITKRHLMKSVHGIDILETK
jgi:Protein of unknown function (DUF1064)